MAPQTNTKLFAVSVIAVLIQLLTLTTSVSANYADLIEKELRRELFEEKQRSNLLPVEESRKTAYNEALGKATSRQYAGVWPYYVPAQQCSQSYTRDTNYNKNQNLKDKIDKLLSLYPQCGMTRLSLTDSFAYDEPEEEFSSRLASRRKRRSTERLTKSKRSASNEGSTVGESPQTKIVGGHMTRKGEWPWLAAIGLKANGPQCGGSLIADRWILTAAHCFDDFEAVCKYNVRLGARNWLYGDAGTTAVDRNVEAIYRHPNYNTDTHANDIALLKLSSPVKMDYRSAVNAICLPKQSRPIRAGTVCQAAGWGLLETNSNIFVLNSRQVDIPVLTYTDPCGDYGYGLMQPGMLCAGYMMGGRDTCQGDSGGPLIYKSNRQWTQVGLTSFGGECAKPRFPGIYTDVGNYLHWIASVLARGSNTLQ